MIKNYKPQLQIIYLAIFHELLLIRNPYLEAANGYKGM